MLDNFRRRTGIRRLLGGTLLALCASACDQGSTADTTGLEVAANNAANTAANDAAGAIDSATSAVESVASDAAAVAELSEFAAIWGPELSSVAPNLGATDHTGAAQTLASLSGERGLLLVFSRSVDW